MNKHLGLVLQQVESSEAVAIDGYEARVAERRQRLAQDKSTLLLNRVMPFNFLGYTIACLSIEGTKPFKVFFEALCLALFPAHA